MRSRPTRTERRDAARYPPHCYLSNAIQYNFLLYFNLFLKCIYIFCNCSNQSATQNLVFTSMRRSLGRLSSNIFLKSPRTPLDVVESFQHEFIWKTYGLTRHQINPRPFYKACISEPAFSYCIFMSEAIMQGITENIPAGQRRYLIDGTFKVVPAGCFTQLLVIYIQYLDDQVSLLKVSYWKDTSHDFLSKFFACGASFRYYATISYLYIINI